MPEPPAENWGARTHVLRHLGTVGCRVGGWVALTSRGPDDERENATALVGLYFNPTVIARHKFYFISIKFRSGFFEKWRASTCGTTRFELVVFEIYVGDFKRPPFPPPRQPPTAGNQYSLGDVCGVPSTRSAGATGRRALWRESPQLLVRQSWL